MAVPNDARLPNAGGTLTAFDVKPTAPTTQNLLVTRADNYGEQTERFDAVNVSVQARMQNGLMVQGGFGPGRQVTDDCDIVDDLPELLQATALIPNRTSTTTARPLERCHENNGWRTGVSGLASYTIPKIDVLVSGTYQNQPGAQINANVVNYPAASTTLGRAFTGAPAGRGFNLLPAGEVLHRAVESDRLPCGEALPSGHHANEHQLRLLQRHELELGADGEPDVQRRVENTAVDPAAAPLQAQRAVRLLNDDGPVLRGPALNFAVTQDSKRKTQTMYWRVPRSRSTCSRCLSFAFRVLSYVRHAPRLTATRRGCG